MKTSIKVSSLCHQSTNLFTIFCCSLETQPLTTARLRFTSWSQMSSWLASWPSCQLMTSIPSLRPRPVLWCGRSSTTIKASRPLWTAPLSSTSSNLWDLSTKELLTRKASWLTQLQSKMRDTMQTTLSRTQQRSKHRTSRWSETWISSCSRD